MSIENKDRQAPEKLECTQSKVIRFNYTWTIENFDRRHDAYESPLFSPGCNEKLEFYLLFKCYTTYQNFSYDAPQVSRKLYLRLPPCKMSEMSIDYTASLLEDCGTKVMLTKENLTYKSLSVTEEIEFASKNIDFAFKKHSHGTKKCKNITIFCEFDIVVKKYLVVPNLNEIKPPECDLHYDMGHLLEDQNFTDVTINVGELKMPAHKAILSARSRVFSVMFKHEMVEKQHNRVEITDVEPEVMRELLRYIYTGKVPLIKTMAHKLLMAAEKYELERLKLMCEEELYTNLTVENATDTLILANLLNVDLLKGKATEFIAQNMAEVMETASFKTMLKDHPYLGLMADIIKCQL